MQHVSAPGALRLKGLRETTCLECRYGLGQQWEHGDVRLGQDAKTWCASCRRLLHLGLEVIRNAAEGVRGDRRASFGCSRAGCLDAKDVQRLQAERHGLRQLAACAAVQAPQQAAIHLFALPCTQAGRTCAHTQCCERQNCMDATQSAHATAVPPCRAQPGSRLRGLLQRPHSAGESAEVHRQLLRHLSSALMLLHARVRAATCAAPHT